jgi:predicted kinase
MVASLPPIELPRFGLVALIGPSGCGKSTWASRHARPTEILSSDAFRALVSDDPNDQGATIDAFDALHLVMSRRMAHRRLSVVDATNVEAWARGRLLDLARTHRAPTMAIVFDVPLEVCLARNEIRGDRRVPAPALRRQWTRMRGSIARLPGEGWEVVHVLGGTEAVDATPVLRVGAASLAHRTSGATPTAPFGAQRNVPKEPRPTR